MEIILETSRLYFRKIIEEDKETIKQFLQDQEVMYAWEHAFSNEEVENWLTSVIKRYERGYSYYAAIKKDSNELIGAIGLLEEKVNEESYIGIGYILKKKFWHQGFAYEGAKAFLEYGFDTLNLYEITAQIRLENFPSIRLATKLGMEIKKQFIKYYNGKAMPHYLYSLLKR